MYSVQTSFPIGTSLPFRLRISPMSGWTTGVIRSCLDRWARLGVQQGKSTLMLLDVNALFHFHLYTKEAAERTCVNLREGKSKVTGGFLVANCEREVGPN